MKESKRKAFNFFKSYYDVYNELSDKEKVAFMDALLERQFFGEEPEGLKGMANFAYLSQKHNIDSQVKGFEDKTKTSLKASENNPNLGGAVGGSQQVQVIEKGKEKEKQKKGSLSDKETKFLELFNSLKKQKTNKESGFRVLSKTDKSNLEQLSSHTVGEFKIAINAMLDSDWPKKTKNQTPTHLLVIGNFNRYLSTGQENKDETDEERVKRLTNEAKAQ